MNNVYNLNFYFVVFIYSMPGYKCPIKERMLYSSCKAPVIDVLEQSLGMEVVKKVIYITFDISDRFEKENSIVILNIMQMFCQF